MLNRNERMMSIWIIHLFVCYVLFDLYDNPSTQKGIIWLLQSSSKQAQVLIKYMYPIGWIEV